ncbi:MAG: hypothetical protein Q4E05_07585 [Pseudoclavibacter sp.]|nr:hypothetical protein [Pseudoclavibacter sp.]
MDAGSLYGVRRGAEAGPAAGGSAGSVHGARRRNRERGSIGPYMILLVLASIVLLGLVVDGAGKLQASTRAHQVAASAARAATTSLASDTVRKGRPTMDVEAARLAAEEYLAAHGMQGAVEVQYPVVTVTAVERYQTRFLGLIGIAELRASGTVSALLVDRPFEPGDPTPRCGRRRAPRLRAA